MLTLLLTKAFAAVIISLCFVRPNTDKDTRQFNAARKRFYVAVQLVRNWLDPQEAGWVPG